METEFSKIPGLNEVIAKAHDEERALRNFACLGVRRRVCGIPIRLMTLSDFLVLIAAQSPFVCGGREPENEDCAQFVWVLSSYFSFFRKLPRFGFIAWIEKLIKRRFTKSIRKLDFEECKESIAKYIDDIFMDSPPQVESKGVSEAESTESFSVGIVDFIASEYGWSRDQIDSKPLPYIYQCMRRIRRRNGDKPINSRSNKASRLFLIEYMKNNQETAV